MDIGEFLIDLVLQRALGMLQLVLLIYLFDDLGVAKHLKCNKIIEGRKYGRVGAGEERGCD